MNTLPFSHNLLLWRSSRNLTQAQLAGRSGIPQPNLSAIERGARDVSLRTLRALAAALQVRPGVLADGIPPAASGGQAEALDRDALERIASAVAGRRVRVRAGERQVVELLKPLVQGRLQALRKTRRVGTYGARTVRLSWMKLRARCSEAVLESLIQRVSEQAAANEPPAD